MMKSLRLILSVTLIGAFFCMSSTAFAEEKSFKVLFLVTSATQFPNGRPTGLWLEEYAVPYGILSKAGAEITVVSPKGGESPVDPASKARTSDQERDWAAAVAALHTTASLSSIASDKGFDAIFIPGGHGPLFDLALDEHAASLISMFARDGKIVSSVCHGPAALLGVTLADGQSFVKGKKLTAFSDAEELRANLQNSVPFSVEQRLVALGAEYTRSADNGAYAVEDGNLITGQNPRSSAKVADLLLARLQKTEKK